jgi:hypothetical protein
MNLFVETKFAAGCRSLFTPPRVDIREGRPVNDTPGQTRTSHRCGSLSQLKVNSAIRLITIFVCLQLSILEQTS